jgi:glycosyltransferase involved in cell wall biosynthesis
MSVRISAVVATRNRAGYLRKAIESLVDQDLGKEMYEIIIADNASQDDTRQVVTDFASTPNVRYLYEPVIGVSRARNTAWQQANGTYVAFLDDDAVACPTWLSGFIKAFEMFTPRPGMVGGRCEPIWEAAQPDWLSDRMLGYLSIVHWSDVPLLLDADKWLSVCNMAIPRQVLQQAGGFREDLGRQGDRLRANPEIYLRRQIESWGFRAAYHPGIAVGHHISEARLTKSWFRKRAYWQGLSDVIMKNPDQRPSLLVRMVQTVKKVGWLLPRLALSLVASSPKDRFRRQCQALVGVGYIAGLWKPA